MKERRFFELEIEYLVKYFVVIRLSRCWRTGPIVRKLSGSETRWGLPQEPTDLLFVWKAKVMRNVHFIGGLRAF